MAPAHDLLARIRSQFRLSWTGIHGARHWARVRGNGFRIAETNGADRDVIHYFSLLHDSQRVSDGYDPGHGQRAVDFARTLLGTLVILTADQFEQLAVACAHHSEGMTSGCSDTILTCWDADRLDLGRVGAMPRAEYLCTPEGRSPETIAWAYARSQSPVEE